MKNQSRLMIAAVYLLIALFAANGGLHRGESVVCVGADGHIDVESFFDGCCGPVAHDDHGAGVNLVMDGSSCGDCVDVHLRVVPLKTRGGGTYLLRISIPGFVPLPRGAVQAQVDGTWLFTKAMNGVRSR